MLLDRLDKAVSVADCGHHIVAVFRQQPDEALAEEDRVIGYHDAHGAF
ncbi:hypothetical protein GCM10022251_06860 [Phytohabitans flavus]|uniref:Uncharacterized protein n=1 Tax=Phytohabitans flavus TaxID=1076124 RepID=A0A6F8Y2E0_9ACTN|nr:hypothetical protein Pflav_065510 [Phytohabitans flavus]